MGLQGASHSASGEAELREAEQLPCMCEGVFHTHSQYLCWVPCYNLSLRWLLGGSTSFHHLPPFRWRWYFSFFMLSGALWSHMVSSSDSFQAFKATSCIWGLKQAIWFWKETVKKDPGGSWFCIRRYLSRYTVCTEVQVSFLFLSIKHLLKLTWYLRCGC